ncbi:MAG: PEP-CTERM sorting domain-containing protein [Terracidiphilus sp.]
MKRVALVGSVLFVGVFAIAPPAFADVTVGFSTPVTLDGFYSSEPSSLTLNDGVTSTSVTSGYGTGAFTTIDDLSVTTLDFSGPAGSYAIDDIEYTLGGTLYTLNFDDVALQNCNCSIGGFYAGLPGSPEFSLNADVLTSPNYNVSGYPFESSPSVIYEGGIETPATPAAPPVPEPGSLLLAGSGLATLAAGLRLRLARG